MSNAHVTLEPTEERHRAALAAAGADPAIWTLQPFNIAEGFDAYFDWLVGERDAGRWIPHVVIDPQGVVVGQSCYLDIRAPQCGVEIGGTWYARAAQGTKINPAAKLLLLDHAFASGMVRVQLKTDVRNERSQAAMRKLGATYEGTFRKQQPRPDGSWRDSVYFSIIDDDWPEIRARLIERLA
ncbi:GNAT family N-acetyltransferase [Sphingomonas panacisoli]|uniref:GNAT family N-acetyltransferase n=1 Tax=Sphingomonas panacisoli TaxID=1813879 RepID=A0A5B8LLN2_9SPHN|nr:GNAT family N-acetyltransferase [Sphingomonas panacisoli]